MTGVLSMDRGCRSVRARLLAAAAATAVAVAPLGAQGTAAPAEPARFHHIHLNVTDVERSTSFYRDTFKVAVEVVEAKPIPEGVWD